LNQNFLHTGISVLEIFIFITTITGAFAAMISTAATLFWEERSTEI
jgi:hypothetical protein